MISFLYSNISMQQLSVYSQILFNKLLQQNFVIPLVVGLRSMQRSRLTLN